MHANAMPYSFLLLLLTFQNIKYFIFLDIYAFIIYILYM